MINGMNFWPFVFASGTFSDLRRAVPLKIIYFIIFEFENGNFLHPYKPFAFQDILSREIYLYVVPFAFMRDVFLGIWGGL